MMRPIAETSDFTVQTRIGPQTVVYLDNRKQGPHWVHTLVADEYTRATGPSSASSWLPRRLLPRIRLGLDCGEFRDVTRVAEWAGLCNARIATLNPPRPLLEVVTAHAETWLPALWTQIVEAGRKPAAVVLSGSPKMLSTDLATDPVLQQTVQLVQHLLPLNIPLLGICFGMQLLTYAGFGALVERRQTPPGRHARVTGLSDAASRRTLRGGKEQMACGLLSLEPQQSLRVTTAEFGWQVVTFRSEHIPHPHPAVPAEAVLAVSHQRYWPSTDMGDNEASVVSTIEVIRAGLNALGIQGHPELGTLVALVLTYLPELAKKLKAQGYNLRTLRTLLQRHMETVPSAAELGAQWFLQTVQPHYLQSA